MKVKKKNPYIGETLGEFVAEERGRDSRFAGAFDGLQLARRLKERREELGVSQAKVARLAGTSQPAIARLEAGDAVPSLDMLVRYARALGYGLRVQFVEAERIRKYRVQEENLLAKLTKASGNQAVKLREKLEAVVRARRDWESGRPSAVLEDPRMLEGEP